LGWYLRKSVKMGPLRINFSKSGIGYSVGVRGARIGTGPRGSYVAAGRGGIYYRQFLNHITASAPPPAVRPKPDMPGHLYCLRCGATVTAGRNFCIHCGSPVTLRETTTIVGEESHGWHLSWWVVVGGIIAAFAVLRLVASFAGR